MKKSLRRSQTIPFVGQLEKGETEVLLFDHFDEHVWEVF